MELVELGRSGLLNQLLKNTHVPNLFHLGDMSLFLFILMIQDNSIID